jgi:predicted RNase H-like HicB family nuclease
LPGCNAWGYSKEQTLVAIRDNAEMYLEVLIKFGDPMPWETGHEADVTSCHESVTVSV